MGLGAGMEGCILVVLEVVYIGAFGAGEVSKIARYKIREFQ